MNFVISRLCSCLQKQRKQAFDYFPKFGFFRFCCVCSCLGKLWVFWALLIFGICIYETDVSGEAACYIHLCSLEITSFLYDNTESNKVCKKLLPFSVLNVSIASLVELIIFFIYLFIFELMIEIHTHTLH